MARSPKYIFSLGLAAKAGRVASGEMMTEKAVRSGNAKLVLTASDASDNTKKKFTDMCRHNEIPIYFPGTMEEIGHAIGKEFRASAAVTDPAFAAMIEKNLETEDKGKLGGNI